MSVLGRALGIFVFVLILFGGHFFVYFSAIKLWNIESGNMKNIFGWTLFFLGSSFFLFSVLSHYDENFFTKTGYLLSGWWLAFGWNLIMTLILFWMILGISKVIGYDVDSVRWTTVIVLITFLFSGYGIWSAFHPKIKNITVEIKNLPDKWKEKKAIQISDVHLGHVYGKKFLGKLVERINREKPDLVFITGDLFDGMDGHLDRLVEPLDDIQASEGIYFVTGNHETYLGVGNALAVLSKTSVEVLDNKMKDIDGVQIVGVGYPDQSKSKNDFSKALKGIAGFDAQEPSILLYHNPALVDSARSLGIDLMLSGHTHRGQLFPFQWIARVVYGEYFSGLYAEKNFSAYTSSGVGTWGPAMRTSGRPEIVVINFK